MALHELAANAAKYGALSVPGGKVHVSWDVTSDPERGSIVRLSWEEAGGPIVTPPSRKGFGHVILEHVVARAVDGHVTFDYASTGVRWVLEASGASLVACANP
jgi:two-component sensor histidine kinase